MAESIFDTYRRHVAETGTRLAVVRRAINRHALLRLGVIVLGGITLFRAVQAEHVWVVMVAFFFVVVCFMGLVWRQSKLDAKRRALQDFLAVNENEMTMQAGGPNRYSDGQIYRDRRHPYSGDLDVFGESSLFALMNRCATPQANRILAGWLSAPADKETIIMRQQVVRELSADTGWHQQLQATLWFNLEVQADFREQFVRFLNNRQVLFGNRYARLYVKAAPWITGACIATAVFVPSFSAVVVAVAIIHLLTAMAFGGKINRAAAHVSRAGRLLEAFSAAFALVESRDWQSHMGKKLVSTLGKGGGSKAVSSALQDLASLIDRLDYRLNMLVGAVLNMVALWDFRQVFALADWRERHGEDILNAFDVVAEAEALGSLAALSRNHPGWAFPEITEQSEPFVEAQSLAHPLIPAGKAVANDYAMVNHRIALITGSNMAGKSTFLRTVGSNAVLAYCGAPVCAERMQLRVFHLVTYMRIADSLSESTSTFKAELDRIQLVLDSVKHQSDALFLVDEMLRGTNSMDKYLGSKAIIKQLIADGGVGMVATHDLQLAKLAEEYPGIIANYHFDIQVTDGEMVFDYTIKPGECTIFNASLLLKRIGITV
ncbi:MutS domain III [Parapedobacter composti]|uniref:MutS domain III n=1 Tax=Parapedobacter composti TaxID=623281 RepID=A0A1I1K2E2_9SPHI|nr:hypothetical protein [Parapedobacter composti]SFC51780.1 MutS domain III [Parapedobacter composti]